MTGGTRRQALLVAILVFLLSLLVSAALLRWAHNNWLATQREQASRLAASHSQVLQRNVERLVSSNYALAAMVRQGDGAIANFDAAAAQLLLANPHLRALSISPGGVVQSVAPLQGNEKLLGFDQLRDPLQMKEAIFARDTGRLTLAGPVALAQGGVGVVSRLPVFLDDAAGQRWFWGFTGVTMLLQDLLRGVALSDLAVQGYDYQMWRLQADSGRKQIIAGSRSALVQPVRQSLEVPNGAWNLDIAPVGGWHDPQSIGWGVAAGGVASLLIAYLAWLLVEQRRYKAGLETQVAQRTAEIFATQNQLKSTLDAIRDPMFELGLDGRYYQCSAPAGDLLVAPGGTLIGKTVPEVLPEVAAQIVMGALRTANQEGYSQGQQYSLELPQGVRWFELSVARKAVDSGHEPRFVVMSRDITERKTAEHEIQRLAFYDPLTELPNRRLLQNRLEHALSATARSHHQGALLLIDLDNFKALNDTVGHDKGDILLGQVANRLLSCVRECDTVARLGGDEFVVMIDDVGANPADAIGHAKTVAEKIVALLGQPYDIAGREHRSSSSVGVALFGVDTGGTVEETFKRSDVAMYQAKAAGRNTLRFFDPAMQAAVEARAALEVDMRQGLANNEFQLHYQPQVGPGGRVVGAEALIRWSHSRHGVVPPGEFIPVAEQSGLILQLGQWVLETACAQLASWSAEPHTAALTLAVNVSVHQFRQPDFVDQVLATLNRSQADARRLKLELTESMFAFDLEDIITKMTALKARGVGFALDDFGTGYSSLTYLKRLPLDQLKIDQSFVRDVLTDPNDAFIVRTIIALGHSLGLHVIAEGVETVGQRDFLAIHGCEWCQGFLISRPLPAADFNAFLLAHGGAQTPA
jgi:diguanylate cyclase (GGDEF)-like protein/PAS domain S-box-containing protein